MGDFDDADREYARHHFVSDRCDCPGCVEVAARIEADRQAPLLADARGLTGMLAGAITLDDLDPTPVIYVPPAESEPPLMRVPIIPGR